MSRFVDPENYVYNPNARLPKVELPGGMRTITATATQLGELLGDTGQYYSRGGAAVRMRIVNGEPALEPLKAASACSAFETVAELIKTREDREGNEITTAATCSESTARQIISSADFLAALPPIVVIAKCPVLIRQNGRLRQITGYDRESGIWAQGPGVEPIPLPEAIARLYEVVADFNFATTGDKARALAALITPGLVMGGLLNGRAPIDLGEADNSQAGKGFRNKLTGAIYRATIKTITQQATGGVGSLKESFDQAVVSGATFISLDNQRGKLDCPAIESFCTEDRYQARIPFASGQDIDPRRTILMMTSNRAETTEDTANRSSCVRILKQTTGYEFAKYPEGDILDHVTANPNHYLAAVFTIIAVWNKQGCPEVTSGGHDFRRWARVLGHITENILQAGPLLDGHREAQQRIASPGLNWLRDIALAAKQHGKLDVWLRSHAVLELILTAGVETQGIDLAADYEDSAIWSKATRAIGRKLAQCFKGELVEIDSLAVERQHGKDSEGRATTEYRFIDFQQSPEAKNPLFPESPNAPEYDPQSFPENPESPNGFNTEHKGNHISINRVIEHCGGLRETNLFGETGNGAIDPNAILLEAADDAEGGYE